MAVPNSREDLKQYALRYLGKPVIKINVSEEQMEDRLDEALQFYQEFHSDATERAYYVHEVTPRDMIDQVVTIPDDVLTVGRMFPPSESVTSGIFDIRYQIRLNDPFTYKGVGGLTGYYIVKSHLAMLENQLSGETNIRFNRYDHKLHVDGDWNDLFAVGQSIILEVYRIIDPNKYTQVYNDAILKRYVTSLFKLQWGNNLSKYDNIQLLGGVTLNGQQMKDEANADIISLREEIQTMWELPIEFLVG